MTRVDLNLRQKNSGIVNFWQCTKRKIICKFETMKLKY